MMLALKDLPHPLIVDYLRGETNENDLETIQTLRDADPATEFFFGLIDKLKRKTRIKTTLPSPEHLSINFSQLNQLLLRIFSGAPKSGDEQRFMDALLFAPVFYKRLLITLPQVTPELAMVDAPEMAEIEMLDDDQILSEFELKKSQSNGQSGALVLVAEELKSRTGQWLDWLVGHPAHVLATAAVVLVALLSPTAMQMLKPDPFADYVYDDKVPYEYRAVIFRSPADVQGPVSDFKKFHRQFQMAMADYMMRRYQDAIGRLQALQPLVTRLTAEGTSPETAGAFRDYYFYLGVSHLAMARGEKSVTDKKTATGHLLQAREQLELAADIAATETLPDGGREIFFIGVSAGFAGDRKAALQYLTQINAESQYFEDSQRLLEAWSR